MCLLIFSARASEGKNGFLVNVWSMIARAGANVPVSMMDTLLAARRRPRGFRSRKLAKVEEFHVLLIDPDLFNSIRLPEQDRSGGVGIFCAGLKIFPVPLDLLRRGVFHDKSAPYLRAVGEERPLYTCAYLSTVMGRISDTTERVRKESSPSSPV